MGREVSESGACISCSLQERKGSRPELLKAFRKRKRAASGLLHWGSLEDSPLQRPCLESPAARLCPPHPPWHFLWGWFWPGLLRGTGTPPAGPSAYLTDVPTGHRGRPRSRRLRRGRAGCGVARPSQSRQPWPSLENKAEPQSCQAPGLGRKPHPPGSPASEMAAWVVAQGDLPFQGSARLFSFFFSLFFFLHIRRVSSDSPAKKAVPWASLSAVW